MTAITTPRAFAIVSIVLFGACLACASCGTSTNGTPPPQNEVKPDDTPGTMATPPNVLIANPASENCVKVGGIVELREEPAGQYGVCVFPDGSKCEEWRLFRGECKQGECRAEDGKCGAKNN